MKYVPLSDGNQNVGSAHLVTNLDTWDGMRWRFENALYLFPEVIQ